MDTPQHPTRCQLSHRKNCSGEVVKLEGFPDLYACDAHREVIQQTAEAMKGPSE